MGASHVRSMFLPTMYHRLAIGVLGLAAAHLMSAAQVSKLKEDPKSDNMRRGTLHVA